MDAESGVVFAPVVAAMIAILSKPAKMDLRVASACILVAGLSACASPPGPTTCAPERDGSGRIVRSRAAVAEFKRMHPCPANGAPSGPCPGYVVDHVIPLCYCGADEPGNMQWQTVAEAKEKDRWERQICRAALSGDLEPQDSR